jgi:hypothetical protein
MDDAPTPNTKKRIWLAAFAALAVVVMLPQLLGGVSAPEPPIGAIVTVVQRPPRSHAPNTKSIAETAVSQSRQPDPPNDHPAAARTTSSVAPAQRRSCPVPAARPLSIEDAPVCAMRIFEAAASSTTTMMVRAAGGGEVDGLRRTVPELGAVYMVHYSGDHVPNAAERLKAQATSKRRRVAMGNVMSNHSIDIDRWILDLDREVLDHDALACLHSGFEPRHYKSGAKAARHPAIPFKLLKTAQTSVNAKHHLALYHVVREGHGMALIIEDDVLFRGCFADHLRTLFDELTSALAHNSSLAVPLCHATGGAAGDSVFTNGTASAFDILMIGGCMRLHAYRRKFPSPQMTKHAFLRSEARCAHAYIVTNRAAHALLQSMPATLPIDFQITRAARERQLRVLWVEPWLSVQGAFGECVTNKLGAGCPSVEKYSRDFDERFARDPGACRSFERVPAVGSER